MLHDQRHLISAVSDGKFFLFHAPRRQYPRLACFGCRCGNDSEVGKIALVTCVCTAFSAQRKIRRAHEHAVDGVQCQDVCDVLDCSGVLDHRVATG